MSEMGEKTCPLCAEEMDLTDQQLKPCKCGYQVCVWCWHQIIDMAEKKESEGRCPACRSPYDKQKIVGAAANCERFMSEVNLERKKTQKAKPKSSETKKQLSSVRVIQRNLVYIVGLPLNLADEDILQRKEYFGQYGRVLKVSMSRTAAGAIQQFPNDTCSVYITYSTEDEAIRCIQSVHGFVFDGRSLKACYGTTKYCHAWLRNVPCTIRDCLYLHEVGPQEDSFSKDEIISATTRSRVQQITGVIHNLQERSGSMLPPPLYDRCNGSSTKPIEKKASNNIPCVPRSSPPDGISARSVTLPPAASWGSRSLSQPSVPSSVCCNEPTKQNPGVVLSAVANPVQVSASINDVLKKPAMKENGQILHSETKPDLFKPLKQATPVQCQTVISRRPTSPESPSISNRRTYFPASASIDNDIVGSMVPNHTQKSCRFTSSDRNTKIDEKIQNLLPHVASASIEGFPSDPAGVTKHKRLQSDSALIKSPGKEVLQRHRDAEYMEVSALQMSGGADVLAEEACVPRSDCGVRTDLETLVWTNADYEKEDDVLSFNSQRHKEPNIMSCSVGMPCPANFLHMSNHMPSHMSQYNGDIGVVNSTSNSPLFDSRGSDRAQLSYEYTDKVGGGFAPFNTSLENSILLPDNATNVKQSGPLVGDSQANGNVDMIEDDIIANILSLDLDVSYVSPKNLASLLGGSDRETSSLKLPRSNSQSRFSFARQDESNNQEFESYDIFNQRPDRNIFYQDSVKNRDSYLDKFGGCNVFPPSNFTGLDNSPTVFMSNRLSEVSRAPVSAPPGFSMPSRSPPPGFPSNRRTERTLNVPSGGPMFGSSLSDLYQASSVGNVGDLELTDPAILAIGQGRLPNGLDNTGLDRSLKFSARFNALENDAKFQQLLMQNPLSSLQNARFSSIAENNLSILGNSHGFSSGLLDQSQGISFSPFSQHSRMTNGHWDGWNKEVDSGIRLGMTDFLGNERMDFSKLYGKYDGSTYNGAYRN